VADFYCPKCTEDYELKSKKENFGRKVVDGAYKTMIKRLKGSGNPNLFLLNYHLRSFLVFNFLVVPKHFFVPDIIEKRPPLSVHTRRADRIGCNILLEKIPHSGRIFLVKDGVVQPERKVIETWNKTLFLRQEEGTKMRGWILDIMKCIDRLGKKEFSLDDVYRFEKELSRKYPGNKHIKDKIRQQLQLLRNRNYLEFLGSGRYRVL